MARILPRAGWRPTKVTLVSGALIAVGLLFLDRNWIFFVLVGLGILGPGLLREIGVLKDQDEFQRQAARRAAYHAFLATGFLAFILVAVLRTGFQGIKDPEQPVSLLLVVLWFTWVLSSLLGYWGPKRTAITILLAFGAFWLIFNILGNLNSLTALVMQCLLAVPFFALALVARRWPRAAGAVLIAASIFFFYYFGLYEIVGKEPLARGRGFVIVIFFGPLFASGVALLCSKPGEEPGERKREQLP
jgi:MFS family permease